MTFAMPIWTIKSFELGSRKWFAHALVVTMLAVTLVVGGCSFASFIAAAEADLPVVLQMITNITNIVAPGVSVPIAAAGALALTSLQILCGTPAISATKCDPTSLVGQYQAAPSTTLLQKIQAALLTVNGHINAMLQVANGLPPGVGAAIVVAIGIALSTVTSILSMIPPSANPAALKVTLATAHKPAKPAALKVSFNAAISGQYPAAVVH